MINTHSLARSVSKKTGLKVSESDKAIRALYETILAELDAGEVVKLGALLKIELETRPARQAWDGINKRAYVIPDKRKLKVKNLTEVTNLENKEA